MDEDTRARFARKFGLPSDQIRTFDELTANERDHVRDLFSLHNARCYVYAVKRAGGLVWQRYRLENL